MGNETSRRHSEAPNGRASIVPGADGRRPTPKRQRDTSEEAPLPSLFRVTGNRATPDRASIVAAGSLSRSNRSSSHRQTPQPARNTRRSSSFDQDNNVLSPRHPGGISRRTSNVPPTTSRHYSPISPISPLPGSVYSPTWNEPPNSNSPSYAPRSPNFDSVLTPQYGSPAHSTSAPVLKPAYSPTSPTAEDYVDYALRTSQEAPQEDPPQDHENDEPRETTEVNHKDSLEDYEEDYDEDNDPCRDIRRERDDAIARVNRLNEEVADLSLRVVLQQAEIYDLQLRLDARVSVEGLQDEDRGLRVGDDQEDLMEDDEDDGNDDPCRDIRRERDNAIRERDRFATEVIGWREELDNEVDHHNDMINNLRHRHEESETGLQDELQTARDRIFALEQRVRQQEQLLAAGRNPPPIELSGPGAAAGGYRARNAGSTTPTHRPTARPPTHTPTQGGRARRPRPPPAAVPRPLAAPRPVAAPPAAPPDVANAAVAGRTVVAIVPSPQSAALSAQFAHTAQGQAAFARPVATQRPIRQAAPTRMNTRGRVAAEGAPPPPELLSPRTIARRAVTKPAGVTKKPPKKGKGRKK